MTKSQAKPACGAQGGCHGAGLFPLCAAQPGQAVQVAKLHAKGEQSNFLKSLGFVENATLHVITAMGSGLVVEVKGTRVALDGQLARCLLVVPQATEESEAEAKG